MNEPVNAPFVVHYERKCQVCGKRQSPPIAKIWVHDLEGFNAVLDIRNWVRCYSHMVPITRNDRGSYAAVKPAR